MAAVIICLTLHPVTPCGPGRLTLGPTGSVRTCCPAHPPTELPLTSKMWITHHLLSEASCPLSPTPPQIWTLPGIRVMLCMSGTSHRQLSRPFSVNLLFLTPRCIDALVPGGKRGSPAITPADCFPSWLSPLPRWLGWLHPLHLSRVLPVSGVLFSLNTLPARVSTLTGAVAACAAHWFPDLALQVNSSLVLLTVYDTPCRRLQAHPKLTVAHTDLITFPQSAPPGISCFQNLCAFSSFAPMSTGDRSLSVPSQGPGLDPRLTPATAGSHARHLPIHPTPGPLCRPPTALGLTCVSALPTPC